MKNRDNVIFQIVKDLLEIGKQHPNRLGRARANVVKAQARRLRELGNSNEEIDHGQT